MKTMGKIYPAVLLSIGLLFGSNANVLAEQTGWLLKTDTEIVGVETIAGGAAPSGSTVSIWDATAYTVVTKSSRGGWPSGVVIEAGEQFVFEWDGGGNDEYLAWEYGHVGDWGLTAPAASSVSGQVNIEWKAYEVSDPPIPLPNYAARVKIMDGATVVEDLGLFDTGAMEWNSSAVVNGDYTIEIKIVDYPSAGIEGIEVATITKQITVVNSGIWMGVSISEIVASITEGESPASQTFEVWGVGGEINYFILDDASWLSCSPTIGSSTGEDDPITVTVIFASDDLLTDNSPYSRVITVESDDALNSPQTIDVVLEVESTIVPGTQTRWLLRTDTTIGVEDIAGGAAPSGSLVYIWDATAYTVVQKASRGGWTPLVDVAAQKQFVFEWAGGGNDEYQNWPYAYVGDWRLIAPATTFVAGSVLIEWEVSSEVSDPPIPLPNYAARVVVSGDGYEEDRGLIWETKSVVWDSRAAVNGNYTIDIKIVDSPFGGAEGIELSTITKQIIVDNSGIAMGGSVSELAVAITEGESPASQTFEVWGIGGEISCVIDDDMDWLACSLDEELSTGEDDPITVTVIFASDDLLTDNSPYSGVITVESDEASNSPKYINVELVVKQVELALSVSEMSASAIVNESSPSAQTFEVWGTGFLTYSVSVSEGDEDWLSCSPAGGDSSGEHDSIAVSFNSDELPVGSYDGVITVKSDEASNSPQTIDVVLEVESTIVPGTQTRWLLKTATEIVGVETIAGGAAPSGSLVYIWDATAYTVVAKSSRGGWPSGVVIDAGEQFVFEWAGGGNDEYLGWEEYGHVGDWRMKTPAGSFVAGDVSIEWLAYKNLNPQPDYAALVKILDGTTLVEDLGLVWEEKSVVWHSQAASSGNYTIDIKIVDSPFDGAEGIEVATIAKQVYHVANPIDGAKTETINHVSLSFLPDDLYVGFDTAGNTLNIVNGGVVTSDDGFIGYENNASGNSVLVNGEGSEWNAVDVYVGGSASAAGGGTGNSLTVKNDGEVSVSSLTVYDGNSGSKHLRDAGNVLHLQDGGTLTIAGDFDAGQGGFDYAGGSLEIGGSLSGLSELLSGNRLEVVEVAGDLTVYGIFSPGSSSGGTAPQSQGMVALAESGSGAVINGALTLGVAGSLEMELGGYEVGAEYDHLAITGLATLDGTLDVVLVDGFMPTGNTSFDLFDWDGGISGSFAAENLPAIPFGLLWNTNGLYSTGEISVELSMVDSDVDGMVDSWEYLNFGGNVSPTGNPDLDPHGNIEEYISGSDPDNAASYFWITNAALDAAGFVVQWDPPVSGRWYGISWTENLTNGFQTLETEIEFPQNSYTDTVNAVGSEGFYRVDVQLK